MSCKWQERVAELEDSAELAAHLAACGGCRDLRESLLADREALRSAHEEALPAAVYTALRARVMAEVAQRRRGTVWRFAWAGLAAAVGVVLLAVLTPPRPQSKVPNDALQVRVEPLPPAAPPGTPAAAPVRRARPIRRRPPVAPAPSLVVKLQTDDPNIVIYWIADGKGD